MDPAKWHECWTGYDAPMVLAGARTAGHFILRKVSPTAFTPSTMTRRQESSATSGLLPSLILLPAPFRTDWRLTRKDVSGALNPSTEGSFDTPRMAISSE